MAKRVSKFFKPKGKIDISTAKLTKDNVADFIISMTEKDISYNFIMDLFGEFDGKAIANPYDIIEIPPNSFYYTDKSGKEHTNTKSFKTTIGIYLFNLILSSLGLSFLFDGYINKNIDKKGFGKIEQTLSYALIEDDITVEQLKKWENYAQWMMWLEDIISPVHSEELLTIGKTISKRKKELLEENKEAIEAGDIVAVEKIEKELIKCAKEALKDDDAFDTYLSGGGGNIPNNFKNMYLIKGAIQNPDPAAKKKYNIVTSAYADGVKPSEYPAVAGSGVFGAYSRGVLTANGGYAEKLIISAFQHLNLDPHGSDCGTKRHIEVELTKDNISDYMYSYIIKNNGELELLTSKNKDKYIGKKVKFRFSSMCESKTGICNKCAGELIYQSVENIGVTMSQFPSTLKVRCMKSFHDSTINTTRINPMDVFFPFGK